jgi:hypothetical protein
MRDLSRWIRDYGHDARRLKHLLADRFAWHQLWTAMDIIDDVESALTAYLNNEFPANLGERYLRIYGVLQGLFIQQDALADLIKAIHPAKEIRLNDVLHDVRDARNASVGRPTQLKRKGALSAHGIVQNSMSKEGFDLHSFPPKDGKICQYVPVQELVEKQRAEAIRILSEVINDLREQEQEYRRKYRDTKLMQVFDQVGYAFEKILEEVRQDSTPILSRWAVDHLQKSLDDFERLLKERGLDIDTYDSVEYLYNEIRHPLVELRKFLVGESCEVLSAKSAVVFTKALQVSFDELGQIAKEIDEEYSSDPDMIAGTEPPNVRIVFASATKDK